MGSYNKNKKRKYKNICVMNDMFQKKKSGIKNPKKNKKLF